MPFHAVHPIQDLFLEVFHMYYNLICNFYMHSYVDKNFHSCKKWVLQFWLLAGSSRRSALAHGTAALGALAVARALEEEDGGGWAGARLLGQEAGGPERLKQRRN
jgi:hypothetical protein